MTALFEIVFGTGALAAIAPLLLARRPRVALGVSSGLLALTGAAAAGLGLASLLRGEPVAFNLPAVIPDTSLAFHVDGLSAFFLVVIGTLTAAVGVYAIGYLRPYADGPGAIRLAVSTAAFVLAMTIVVTASNWLLFLAAWELMSVASYLLVVHHHHSRQAREAGFVYLVMTHVGTAFILAAFLAVPKGGDPFAFATLKAGAAAMSGSARSAIFLALVVGFGTKAGIVPLHIWLPRAHPQAPSHASALMSGVMIKTAIYGIIRFGMDVLGPGPAWWGATLLVLGAVSAVVGVLYALMEHDLKRLLAFHSVENIGIILLGIGASMTFASTGRPTLAALALAAGLFHTLNHAVFKGLLFLGAGAVDQATGTKNIEAYGGLAKLMPCTAGFFLVGCLSISGLPPFNGFASEWLTYQALIGGFPGGGTAMRVILPLAAVMLALTGGLAAACFVKAFGISFLARPRSPQAREAREVSGSLLAGMAVLAILCLGLGLFSAQVLQPLGSVTRSIVGASAADAVTRGPIPMVRTDFGTLSMPMLAAGLAVFILAISIALPHRQRKRVTPTWGCGIDLDASMEYTATGFSQPIRQFFRAFFRPHETVHEEKAPGGFFVKRVTYDAHVLQAAEHYIYKPMYRSLLGIAHRASALQAGSLHLYLLYILITVVILLLWVT